MTAETDLLPLPWIERYAVVGDIAYPVSSDPDGDYVAHDDHAAAMQAYARACVSSATEALRAEVERLNALIVRPEHSLSAEANRHYARAERLAEALLTMCNVIDGHDVPVAIEAQAAQARAALDQETTNG